MCCEKCRVLLGLIDGLVGRLGCFEGARWHVHITVRLRINMAVCNVILCLVCTRLLRSMFSYSIFNCPLSLNNLVQ